MSYSNDPLRDDFRKFVWMVWKHLNLPDPTPLQYDIARYLQHGPNKQCIEAFRGCGKSWLTSAYALWVLYLNPQMKIMVVSASKNRADNFTTFLLRLIREIDELKHLEPTPDQRCSRVEFDVGPSDPDQTPSVFSRGIGSQLTGGRADIIISDDVEVANNSMTIDMRDKLQEQTKEYTAILKPLPTSKIIYLGTPQTEDSIYTKLPETFDVRIWPSRVPTEKERPHFKDNLAPFVDHMFALGRFGEPVDPARFDEDKLLENEAEYGKAGFQLQFQLNTRLSDLERFPLKVKDLVMMPVPKERAPLVVNWLPHRDKALKDLPCAAMTGDGFFEAAGSSTEFKEYELKVLSVDPSGRGADETGYAVGMSLNGFIWVPAAGGLQGGYDDETLQQLARIAAEYQVHKVVVESNFGDGMFSKLFQPVLHKYHKCAIEEVRNSIQKERRIIDTLEPLLARHKMILDPEVVRADFASAQGYEGERRLHKQLVHQLTRVCYDKGALRHDDRLDALAIMAGYFTEKLARDENAGLAQERHVLMQKEIDAYMKHALGNQPVPNVWISV